MAKDGQGGAPACEECDPLLWWPEAAPSDIALSSLPAAGAISNPLRLPGRAPWLGLWGEFAGLRVGITGTGQSYPARSASAFPYPQLSKAMGRGGVDLYLSADTGFWGTVTLARFWTREAALAWGGATSFSRTTTSPLGPFPAASALNDADPNPTTTRVGSNNLIWDGATWERWKHAVWGDNAPLVGLTPATNSFGSVYSDRTGNYFKQRQSNATAPKSVVQSAISLASTGVKATRTMAQDGYIRFAVISTLTGTPTNAVVQLQLVRSAVTYALGNTGQLPATLNVSFPIGFVTSNVAPWIGIPVVSGDVVQINVLTASAAATADFALGIEENLYAV